MDVLPFITMNQTISLLYQYCVCGGGGAATYSGGAAGRRIAFYHNGTNFYSFYINIVGAATYAGGEAAGCIAIYHNGTNRITILSILWWWGACYIRWLRCWWWYCPLSQ